MNLTPAQQQAIESTGNLVVTAGAGSGKTHVLVARYLRLLQERLALVLSQQPDEPPDALPGILAITFTDKAAREMRTRVRDAVAAHARKARKPAERAAWEQQQAAVEAARIGTIHSFCGELLRAQPAESGLDPQFRVLDEVESGWLREAAVDHTLSELAALLAAPADSSEQPDAQDAALAHMLALQQEYGLDELRAILVEMLRSGPEARAAVAALPAHPDEMHAAWQARLAKAQAEVFKELLDNAAWRAACAEILRLAPHASPADRLGNQVATLAAWLAAAGIAGTDALPHEPPPIPDFTPVLAIDARHGSKKNWPHPAQLAEAREALKALREACKPYAELLNLAPDADLEQRSAQAIAGLCALYRQTQAEYSRRKEEQDALDYDDMLLRARCLLQEHPAVRQRWQAEFYAVLVDEFQDTNDEQRALIYALVGLGQTPPAAGRALPELFVVGDGKQSIYRFRGADVSVFRSVADDIQRHAGHSVALDTSFRTHALLVDWVNQVGRAMFARQRPLHPYETPFEPLQAQRPAPPFHRCVELHIIDDAGAADERRAAEARIIAGRIKALQAGAAGTLVYGGQDAGWRVPTSGDIAILCQASSAFAFYEEALQAEGIPYLTTAGRGYFGRQEVQDLIHLLRVLNDPGDELALVGVLRSPLFALDDATILRLRLAHPRSLWEALHAAADDEWPGESDIAALAFARDTLARLYPQRGRLTVVELLREVLAATGYLATISALPNGAQRRANVEKLIEAARRSGSAGLFTFSAYLENLLKAEPHEGEAPLEAEGSVRLMTIHRSKGLEFPIVVLPDLARTPPQQQQRWLGKPAYGLALRLRDRLGNNQDPLAYGLALREEKLMQQAERERLLYVALTRARDYLILSGAAEKKSGDSWLSRLLAALGFPWENGGIPGGSHGPLAAWLHEPDTPARPQP